MEMLQTILVVVLLAIWLLFSVVFLITAIQNLINDHKREIREQESAKRDLEYHEARMKVYEKGSRAQPTPFWCQAHDAKQALLRR